MMGRNLLLTVVPTVLLLAAASCCKKPSDTEVEGGYKCEANLSAALVDTVIAAEKMPYANVSDILKTVSEEEKKCPVCGKLYSFNPDRK